MTSPFEVQRRCGQRFSLGHYRAGSLQSWFIFNIHMDNFGRLLEIWALMQHCYSVPIPWMIRFFSSASGSCVGQYLTIQAMFDLLGHFLFLFISAHELCCQYSTMYGKVHLKLLGYCVQPPTFGVLKHSLFNKACLKTKKRWKQRCFCIYSLVENIYVYEICVQMHNVECMKGLEYVRKLFENARSYK